MRTKRKLDKRTAVREIGGYAGRIAVVGLALALFLSVCLAKVGYLQLMKGQEMQDERAPLVEREMGFFAKRGRILDREGNILAMSIDTLGVQVFRPDVRHPDYLVDYLAGILAIDRATAHRKALCEADYCYVERFLDPKISEPLERVLTYSGDNPSILWQQEMLSGIQVVRAAARLYPHGETAGQVVGIARVPTGTDDGSYPSPMRLEGQYGIEFATDEILAGHLIVQKGQKRQNQGMSLYADNPDLVLDGSSVVLSLDVNIQTITEEELRKAVISSLAKRGIALVMEVKTGELLAVAHYPPFNPNSSAQYRNDELWKWNDAAFTEILEPGSTLKPVIIAAAVEEGVVSMDDLIFCENGSWKIEKREKPITDHGRYEYLTVWDVLKQSSNIGCGKIGLKLGAAKLQEYLTDFGFGRRTGVKLGLREANGIISKSKLGWSKMEIANAAFGQGVAVTAVQLLGAIAALGNDGKLMKPILIKEVVDGTGATLTKHEPTVVAQAVSPRAARLVLEAMRRVVEPGGTGERAAVFGFETCGKTGTAQKVMTVEDPTWQPGGERKRAMRKSAYVDKWIGSFVGMVPVDDPKLAILVIIDEPYLNDFGGVVAAPAFSRIGSRTLAYLNVIPSEEFKHRARESAPIPENRAGAGEQAVAHAVSSPRGVGPAVVPDFAGMSVGEALRIAWQSRVKLAAEGVGVAVSQEPGPNEVVEEWGKVKVVFNNVGNTDGGEQ